MNQKNNTKLVGHLFLKKLGKTKLRPGGIRATNFLLQYINFNKNPKILEIACNNGVNLITLSKKYKNSTFIGVDLDKKAIEEANTKKKIANLNNCTFLQANAFNLPFEDESFDYIINEAMLTMLPFEIKEKVLKEVFRVLKKDGLYLTHDIALINNQCGTTNTLSKAINMKVNPLITSKWLELFKNNNFVLIDMQKGSLSLMNPIGMLRDEGLFNTIKIIKNGLKSENRNQFLNMKKTFKKLNKKLNYIVLIHKK